MLVLSLLVFIFSGLNFWSCQVEELPQSPENGLKLKSGIVPISPNCTPVTYDLYVGRVKKVGQLIVSNNNEYLQVEYKADDPYLITKVHLWVGVTSLQVPKNSKGVPVPNRFKYQASGLDCYFFQIRLSDIYSLNPEVAFEERTLYIFAQAEVDNLETPEIEKETAWSDGANFSKGRGTFSNYKTCAGITGGGGCFQHDAFGGDNSINGLYYFDINNGTQKIHTDIGDNAGEIIYDSGKLIISFQQNWMLKSYSDGRKTQVKIQGYNNIPTSLPTTYNTYVGDQLEISVSGEYAYFIIFLDLQQCYTTNP